MEQLKQDLKLSLQAVKTLQEGSELWRWHDGRIRYLLECLYGNNSRGELSEDGRTTIQEPQGRHGSKNE